MVLTQSKKKSDAEAQAKAAAGHSISAGVLHSNDFSGLKPGLWVAFMGQYTSRTAAERAQKRDAAQGYPGTPRLLKPKKK